MLGHVLCLFLVFVICTSLPIEFHKNLDGKQNIKQQRPYVSFSLHEEKNTLAHHVPMNTYYQTLLLFGTQWWFSIMTRTMPHPDI